MEIGERLRRLPMTVSYHLRLSNVTTVKPTPEYLQANGFHIVRKCKKRKIVDDKQTPGNSNEPSLPINREEKVYITDPAYYLSPEEDEVCINGRRLPWPDWMDFQVWAFHKPTRMETTKKEGAKMLQVLKDLPPNVVNLGRLDKMTSGLLLFSANSLLLQVYCQKGVLSKTYVVTVEGSKSRTVDVELLITNVMDHVSRKVVPKSVRWLRTNILKNPKNPTGQKLEYVFECVMLSGEKRIVRRIFSSAGVRVKRLHRSMIGTLRLNTLVPEAGDFVELNESTKQELIKCCGGVERFLTRRVEFLERRARDHPENERLVNYLSDFGVQLCSLHDEKTIQEGGEGMA